MNRTEYMRQLESLLQNISATEREEALQYYNEYFNDAGPENEQNVIEERVRREQLPESRSRQPVSDHLSGRSADRKW